MSPRVRELRISYAPKSGPLPRVGTPADAVALLRARLEQEPVEVVVVLLLNTKHRVIALHEVGRGTLDTCLVHPRDVFKCAVLANAAGVIIAHNHPSGDPSPSPDDIALHARLPTAGTLLGIELLDFLIIGDNSHVSFLESGR